MLSPEAAPHERSAPPLTGISKSCGATRVLDTRELDVRPGETLALLGLIEPDAGSAWIFRADPRRCQTRRMTGAMLQTGGVPPTATVREPVESRPVSANDRENRRRGREFHKIRTSTRYY